MRIKTLLTSTVFFSSLIATASLAPHAMAQKGSLHNPVSEWAVTKVGESGVNGYCALARRFQRNTILTLARNQANEASIAFDFQRPKLNKGQVQKVILDPGAGQQRRFNLAPNSTSALVVRLGRDENFFAALEKTGYLRAEIGTQSYHFNLADIDSGQSELSACVSAMTQPAAGGDSAGNITPYPFDSTGGYVPRATSRDVKALEAENEQLRLSLAQLRSEGHKRSANFNRRAADDIERLKKENSRLKQSLALVQNGAQATNELRAELSALKEQNAQLKSAAVTGASDNSRELLVSLQQENARLQQRLAQRAAVPAAEKTQGVIAALEKENATLKRDLERSLSAQINAEAPSQELASLQSQITSLREQNATLRAAADETRREVETAYEEKLQEQRAQNKKLQEALDNQGVDVSLVDGLREQLSQLRNENSLLQQTAAQSTAQALREKNAEIADLKQQLRDVKNSGDSLASLEDELATAIKERNTFEAAAKAQRKEIAALKGGNGFGGDSKVQAKLAALGAENETLKAELASSYDNFEATQANAAELALLEQENERLNERVGALSEKAQALQTAKAELATVRAENNTLVEQLTLASASSGEINAQLQSALADNEILKTQLNSQSDNAAQIAALNETLEALQGENQSLQLALNDKQSAAQEQLAVIETETAQKLAEAQQTIESLQGENSDLAQKIASLETVKVDPALEKKVAVLEIENDKLVAALEDALDQASSYRTALAEQEQVGEQGNAQLAEMSAEIEGLKSENEVLKQDLASVETSNAQLLAANEITEEMAAEAEEIVVAGIPKPAPEPVVEEDEKASDGLQPGGMLGLAQQLNAIEAAAGDEVDVPAPEKAHEMAKDAQQAVTQKVKQAVEPIKADIQPESEPVQIAKAAPVSVPTPSLKPAIKQEKERQLQERIKRELQEQMDIANAENAAKVAAAQGPVVEDVADDVESEEPQEDVVVEVQPSEPLAQDPTLEPEMVAGMTEAQKQEAMLQQRLEMDAEPEIAMPKAPIVAPDTAIDVAAAEQELEEFVDEAIADGQDVAASVSQNIPTEEMQTVAVHNVAQELEQQEQAAIVGAPQSLEQESVAPVVTSGAFQPAFTVNNMLSRASITADAINMVEKASGPNRVVHQWTANNVYGSAEQKPLRSEAEFEEHVMEYLTKTESRCQGEFAVVPDNTAQYGETRVDSYEVACVGAGANSSASLLFFNKGGTFTVVAHEAPTEYMDGAMALRDQLKSTVSGS